MIEEGCGYVTNGMKAKRLNLVLFTQSPHEILAIGKGFAVIGFADGFFIKADEKLILVDTRDGQQQLLPPCQKGSF